MRLLRSRLSIVVETWDYTHVRALMLVRSTIKVRHSVSGSRLAALQRFDWIAASRSVLTAPFNATTQLTKEGDIS